MTGNGEKVPTKDERIAALISAAVAPRTGGKRQPKRHPMEVTADRLAGHLEDAHARLSGAQRDKFSAVIFMLERLAEGLDP